MTAPEARIKAAAVFGEAGCKAIEDNAKSLNVAFDWTTFLANLPQLIALILQMFAATPPA